MSDKDLRYDLMVEDALRDVVRRSLEIAATRGLPGDHHFYITFRTAHPGVKIPAHLHERYANEMTIVLQYQFWGLEVGEREFRVTLSFNDKPERLVIPFEAIKAFADPSVRFGLQFDSLDDEEEDGEDEGEASADGGAAVTDFDFGTAEPPADKGEDAGAEKTSAPADKVVTLDAFRKK